MLKVGIDFDETLVDWKHDTKMQELTKILIAGGADVYIITARLEIYKNGNDEVFELADKLGISRDHIIMTNLSDKYPHMQRIECDILFDNKWQEIHDVNQKGGFGILVDFNPFKVLQEETFTINKQKGHKKYPC